ALEQAQQASQARLDATRLGRKIGERTTLELLNAENELATTSLSLAQARTELLLNRLRIRALIGQLDETALQAAQSALATTAASR
ncbi:MAG: TolC family protein, partial [Rhodocyclaceae bacterium]|nr:TolC family protein [Rhodocyclaceae bacterium]